MVATVLAIRPNTPMGANRMINMVRSIITPKIPLMEFVSVNLYSDFYSHRISIYGINGGGINLKREYKKNSSVILREINVNNFTPKIELINQLLIKYKKNGGDTSLYNIALTFAFINEHVDGLVIAPSNLSQLKATIFSFNKLVQGINLPYYKKIIGIINSYE